MKGSISGMMEVVIKENGSLIKWMDMVNILPVKMLCIKGGSKIMNILKMIYNLLFDNYINHKDNKYY